MDVRLQKTEEKLQGTMVLLDSKTRDFKQLEHDMTMLEGKYQDCTNENKELKDQVEKLKYVIKHVSELI